MKPTSQSARLLRWLRENPGSSSLDITLALRIVNVTGRVSDLRAAGYVIDCREDKSGVARYTVREATPGVARFDGSESKAQVDRQMTEAFAPVEAAMDAWRRVFGEPS